MWKTQIKKTYFIPVIIGLLLFLSILNVRAVSDRLWLNRLVHAIEAHSNEKVIASVEPFIYDDNGEGGYSEKKAKDLVNLYKKVEVKCNNKNPTEYG